MPQVERVLDGNDASQDQVKLSDAPSTKAQIKPLDAQGDHVKPFSWNYSSELLMFAMQSQSEVGKVDFWVETRPCDQD